MQAKAGQHSKESWLDKRQREQRRRRGDCMETTGASARVSDINRDGEQQGAHFHHGSCGLGTTDLAVVLKVLVRPDGVSGERVDDADDGERRERLDGNDELARDLVDAHRCRSSAARLSVAGCAAKNCQTRPALKINSAATMTAAAKAAASRADRPQIRSEYRKDSAAPSSSESNREQVLDALKNASPLSKDVHDKYRVSGAVPKIARNGIPLRSHCPPSYFLQITTTWDRGNRSVREKILSEFVASNEKKTGPQLEKEFCNGASLFLTRISAWLRLTYLLAYDLALQLRAITIFVSASSGNRFLSEFLEVGGVLTVLEILTLSQAKEVDKAEALRLLLHVAGNGRKYKEFICESFGVRQVTECLSKSRSEVTQDYARNLLIELGTGNPKFQMQVFKGLQSLLTSQAISPSAQQMSGQALRALLPTISNVPIGFVDPTMSLLKSPHIQVQYEGYEILRDLISRPSLQDPIIMQLITILRNVVDDGIDDVNDERHRRNKIDSKGLASQWAGISTEEQKEKDLIASGYVQQAYAAKILGIMVATTQELAERMIQFQLVSGLLNVIANVGHPDSQRYAASTLIYLVENFDYVAAALRNHMGSNFFEILEHKPDTFYKELTKEQARYLRKNTVRIKRVESHSRINEPDSGSDSSDDETGQKSGGGAHGGRTKRDITAFPSNRDDSGSAGAHKNLGASTTSTSTKLAESMQAAEAETHANQQDILKNYERDDDDEEELHLVDDVYTPFVQTTTKGTFAGNKYVVGASPSDGAKKFTNELEKFRNTTLKNKRREGKKEFDVVNPPELQERLKDIKTDPMLFSKEMAISGDIERKRVPLLHSKTKGGTSQNNHLSATGSNANMSRMPSNIANSDNGGSGDSKSGKDDENGENFSETDLELTPEEEEARKKMLQMMANEQNGRADMMAGIAEGSESDPSEAASYRPSVVSDASDGDTELLGSEADYSASMDELERVGQATNAAAVAAAAARKKSLRGSSELDTFEEEPELERESVIQSERPTVASSSQSSLSRTTSSRLNAHHASGGDHAEHQDDSAQQSTEQMDSSNLAEVSDDD